jgi:hypothetical protein
MYVFEVRNAELIESLTKQAAEQNITYAAIVALIGARCPPMVWSPWTAITAWMWGLPSTISPVAVISAGSG